MPEVPYDGPYPAEGCWSRVVLYAERLSQAIDELEEAGGVGRLAGRWNPKSAARAAANLRAARASLDGVVRVLEARNSASFSGRRRSSCGDH